MTGSMPIRRRGKVPGAGEDRSEGWAGARPEWGMHRAPRRAEPKSMNSSQAELRRRDGVEVDRQVARSRRAERRSLNPG